MKQEAHGPRFAHLSDTATADMQMLCNIFPILSSQLMKISSFEQFLICLSGRWRVTLIEWYLATLIGFEEEYMGLTVNGAWSFE